MVTLYRYDISGRRLQFVTDLTSGGSQAFYESSPEGRYFYFDAKAVAGLPGGGEELEQPAAATMGRLRRCIVMTALKRLCSACRVRRRLIPNRG